MMQLVQKYCSLFHGHPYVLSKSHPSVIKDPDTGVPRYSFSKKSVDVYKHVNTLHEMFLCGSSLSRTQPCLGNRTTTSEPYVWLTYEQVDERVMAFGSAMLHVMGRPSSGPNFVGICSRNSPEWIITEHACAAYSYVYVPLYDTLGAEAIQYIADQTQPKMVVCYSIKEAELLLSQTKSDALEHVIFIRSSSDAEDLQTEYSGRINFYNFDKFLDIGRANLRPKQMPQPDDLCTLCYTSGSTGTPKGVMIQHNQMVDAIRAVITVFHGQYLDSQTVHLSYLPMAHIMEQLISSVIIACGGRMGFLSVGLESMLSDFATIRPTVLVAVPRTLAKLRSEFYKKFPAGSYVLPYIEQCIQKKTDKQNAGSFGYLTLVDYFIFSQFRKMFGNRVSVILTGSAPLCAEVSRFYRAVFGCSIFNGYGLTEASGIIYLTHTESTGDTHFICTELETKLASVPHMGIDVEVDQIGEICVRGLRCTKGYYEDQVNTDNLIDHDGFIHTGDIGRWNLNGTLDIVDRCKSMFKLAQGEYIVPAKIENLYLCSPMVQHVLVDGDSTQSYAVAIIQPDFPVLRDRLKRENMTAVMDLTEEILCSDAQVRKFLLTDLNEYAILKGVKSFELAKSVHLTSKSFTVANGLLTPTMKLVRFRARKLFQQEIRRMYGEGRLVQ